MAGSLRAAFTGGPGITQTALTAQRRIIIKSSVCLIYEEIIKKRSTGVHKAASHTSSDTSVTSIPEKLQIKNWDCYELLMMTALSSL